MREIFFRGKRVDNGEWVYGYLARFRNFRNKVYTSIIQINDFETQECNIQDNSCVFTETVGQFTGLTDKNDKKIFEGDIVKITDEFVNGTYYAYVEFGNPNGLYTWGWQLVPLCKTAFAVEILHWVDMEESGAFIEVIGNIHDNPELLEEEE